MANTPQPVVDPSPGSQSVEASHAAKTEGSTPGDHTATTFPPDRASMSQGTFVLNADVGTMIDQYRLDEKLGEGGMGAVWKAFHIKLKKHVALKLLPPHFTRDAKLVGRFEREMEAVGKVDSPHVVRAMDAGEFQGLHYLVMEYVDGTDLSQFVKARGPQPVRNACELVRQAALGLAAAHKLGLVHRDIKPSNLFLTKPRDGGAGSVVKILDLGLARLQDDTAATDPGAGLTGTGTVMGTPDYMAPEQWGDTHRVDARADLYSLGCTLYFLLTGRPPFGDEAHSHVYQKMAAHVNDPIPDLRAARSDVTPDVDALYRRLMAKKPEDRVQTADELAATLVTIVKNLGSGGPSAGTAVSQPAAPRTPSPAPSEAIDARPSRGKSSGTTGKKKPAAATDDDTLEQALQAMAPAAPLPRTSGRRTPASSGKSGRPPRSGVPKKVWIVGGGLAAVVLLAGIIIKITNKDGTTTEIKAPDALKVEITKTDDAKPAEPKVGWHGWPADAPKPAIAPFNAEQAKKHQEKWAAYLKIPVEHTNSIGMKFVLIPPGEFTMGSTKEEIEETLKQIDPNDKHWQECVRSEAPQHKVILTQPIYLGVTEVTQADYEKVMGKNPSFFAKTGPEKQWVEKVEGLDTSVHPVENVSWNDAAEFCAKLSQQEKLKPFYFRAGETVTPLDGTGYRLPTEAEWEFSCRAGTTTKFWIGDTDNDLIKAGWFGNNSGGRTHAAGELRANPFGLYDIHGNVWEWVQDWWEPTFYGQFQEKPALNPNAPSSAGSQRVIRGGHWYYTAFHCRSSDRFAGVPSGRSFIGFRMSLVAVGSRAGR